MNRCGSKTSAKISSHSAGEAAGDKSRHVCLPDAYAEQVIPGPSGPSQDQHHQGVVKRGDEVMGFSHEKTAHHFRFYADGGAIEAEANDLKDAASRDQIRSHFKHIVTIFAAGDFSAPMLIHAQNPPGSEAMKRLRNAI